MCRNPDRVNAAPGFTSAEFSVAKAGMRMGHLVSALKLDLIDDCEIWRAVLISSIQIDCLAGWVHPQGKSSASYRANRERFTPALVDIKDW